MAEISAPAAKRRRGPGRPFQKGQSGNPGGRPEGLAAKIRAATNNGDMLIEFVLGIVTDESERTAMRLEAATWLADRGFGRPTQAIELRGEEGGPLQIAVEDRSASLADVAALLIQVGAFDELPAGCIPDVIANALPAGGRPADSAGIASTSGAVSPL